MPTSSYCPANDARRFAAASDGGGQRCGGGALSAGASQIVIWDGPDVLGHSRASGPAPNPAECFVGGPAAPNAVLRQGWGELTKQNVAQRWARGLSAAVPR